MTLPWSHRLPDYAKVLPEYGQNLVRLAEALRRPDGSLTVLDVGANVGDSTLQILHAVPGARVLCVEADDHFLGYLRTNVDHLDAVDVVPALLAVEEPEVEMASVRRGGTAHFEPGSSGSSLAVVTPSRLRDEHSGFGELNLLKTDTDGYDALLAPAVAEAWADSHPVLFVEFDRVLSERVGTDVAAMWPALTALGYDRVGVWDNLGAPLRQGPVDEIAAWLAAQPTGEEGRGAHTYWDVAVVHADDPFGRQALDTLF